MREEAWRLADGLTGRSLPSTVLMSSSGEAVALQDLTNAVLYLYPGGRASPMENDTPMVDAVLHRAFRDRLAEITKLGFKVLAVSTEDARAQIRSMQANAVTHQLLTDPECRLAKDLRLPIFPLDGALWYERLTLVTCAGRIRRVFFPVLSAHRNPQQVLSWIRVRVTKGRVGS